MKGVWIIMNKRLAALFIALILALCLSGCKRSTTVTVQEVQETYSEPVSSAMSGSVELTLPKAANEICGDFISRNSASLGINPPHTNSDGTLQVTVLSNDRETLKQNSRILVNSVIQELKKEKTYITDIEIDRNLTTVTVICNKKQYTSPGESFFISCYEPIVASHALSGDSGHALRRLQIDFVFIDASDYSAISKYRYPSEVADDDEEEETESNDFFYYEEDDNDYYYEDNSYNDYSYEDYYYDDNSYDYTYDDYSYDDNYYYDDSYEETYYDDAYYDGTDDYYYDDSYDYGDYGEISTENDDYA